MTEYEPPDEPANRIRNDHRPNGRFAPGNNANPSGRPKSAAFAALCRAKDEQNVDILVRIAKRGGLAGVRAIELMFAYGHGKPETNINANVRAGSLDDARFRGAARAALEAAVSEAEGGLAPIPEAK